MSSLNHQTRRTRPRLEALEDRALPSLSSVLVDVNTAPIRASDSGSVITANASSAGGLKVAVWMYQGVKTDWDIHAQLYNANGTKRGGEIKVTATRLIEEDPAVGMDAKGNFTVAWTAVVSAKDTNIMAARFSAAGKLLSTFAVAKTRDLETSASVAVADDGTTLIAYVRRFGKNDNVYAGLYTPSGKALKSITVAGSALDEGGPAAAVGGGTHATFAVAYQVRGDVDLKRYSPAGKLLAATRVVATSAFESLPRVAMDDAGEAVVTWQVDGGIQARTVARTGKLGKILSVATADVVSYSDGDDDDPTTYKNDTFVHPSITMNRANGDFVVVYTQQVDDGINLISATSIIVDELTFGGGSLNEGSAGEVGDVIDTGANGVILYAGNPAVSISRGGVYIVSYAKASSPQGFSGTEPKVLSDQGHLA